jgi:nitrite reductase/ring-hydroxylating ferredoxin subunit
VASEYRYAFEKGVTEIMTQVANEVISNLDYLVAPDGSRVRGSLFSDEDLYRRELDTIFAKSWLFVAHESQIQGAGDWVRSAMGDDPVIVVRGRDGHIHVHFNQCAHRGMPLCRADSGSSRAFTCSNHGWSFRLDGSLSGVPRRQYYGDKLDMAQHGLKSVPRVETYRGLIFANFDPDAVPLIDYLGEMAWYLDVTLDHTPSGTVLLDGCARWELAMNWKWPSEGNTADIYHAETTHRSVYNMFPSSVANAVLDYSYQVTTDSEHYMVLGLVPEAEMDNPENANPINGSPEIVTEYYSSLLPSVLERLGPVRSRMRQVAGLVWPNLAIIPSIGSIHVIQPKGAQLSEIWSWQLVDRDAPDDVKQAIRRTATALFGPGGLIEQDDGENWTALTKSAAGHRSSANYFDVSMGIDGDFVHPELPGISGPMMSEHNIRGFYRRWRKEIGQA